jgi:hypothetical protein
MEKNVLTDEEVEKERIRLRRRQHLYRLRTYKKKGKELASAGITIEMLEALDKECAEET